MYPIGYNENDLNTLLRSSDFDAWLSHLADQKAKGQNPGAHNERDIWEFQRLRTCWRRRLGDAYSCRSGISSLLHSNGIDRLFFAGCRCKSVANERHRQSEENGPRTQESEALRGTNEEKEDNLQTIRRSGVSR